MSEETTETTTPETSSADAPAEGGADVDGLLPVPEASPSADASAPEDDEDAAKVTPEEAEKKARHLARLKAADEAEKLAATKREARKKAIESEERERRIVARERQADEAMRAMQQQMQELATLKQRILSGGPEALEAIGTSFDKLTHQYLEANTPEALARRAFERTEALEKQLREEREQRAREERQRAEAAEAKASRERFEAFLDGAAGEYPYAADMAPTLLHREAQDIAKEFHAQFGEWPGFDALAVRLDERARILQEEAQTRRAKRAPSSTTPSDGAPPPTQAATSGHTASRPAPRTLPNAVAGTRATPKRPMTDEEIDEWARAELRQALANDRKASA